MSRYRSLGLTREPFAPEPDLAFQSPALGQTDALTRLTEFVIGRGTIALVLGPAGIGKTMLRLALTRDLAPQPALRIVALDRPDEWSTDVAFLKAVSAVLGGEVAGRTTLDLLTEIETILAIAVDEDHQQLLLIDDAHRLTSSQLELLRTVSSIEPNSLSIVLFAEPELDERIARRRSLAGRITMRHTLNPLNSNDAVELLHHRLTVAGAEEAEALFDGGACNALVVQSGGNPGALIALAAKAVDLGARRNVGVIDRSIANEATGVRERPLVSARQIAFDLDGMETGHSA